jgi:hypothetical protein
MSQYLKRQTDNAWDLETDLPWQKGINLELPFVTLDPKDLNLKDLSAEEERTLTQYLGLVINSTFCELELSLERSRPQCWERMMVEYPSQPEMEALGENFFLEEKKHSMAFMRFLEMFAKQTNVTNEELRQILPVFDNSKIEDLFRYNGLAGGNAMWWVVASVEEESIRVYQKIAPHRSTLDPLFFEIHHKHFLEESRHSGYAFMMLELFHKRAQTPVSQMLKKLDFMFSEVMQATWILHQLTKINNVKKLQNRHPFYEILARLLPRLMNRRPWEMVEMMFLQAPYISLMLNPMSNRHIKKYVNRYDLSPFPRPSILNMGFKAS